MTSCFSFSAFKILSKGAKKEDIIRFLNGWELYDPEDLHSILRVSVAANEDMFMELEREGIMMGAFERVFHNELAEARSQGRDEGIAFGVERGMAIGTERGITIGEERGITIGRNEGITIGRNEGITIGEERARRSIMERLIAGGISPQQAAAFTGMNV